jgi:30S ribosomal protein S31
MGKGDKKSRRGKLFKGTYGRLRPHKLKTEIHDAAPAEKPAEKKKPEKAKKTAAKKE